MAIAELEPKLALSLARGASLEQDDPMAYFQFKGIGQEMLFLWVNQEIECYWRAGNQGGKTYGGAAMGIALARGKKELNGLPVPPIRVPSVGYVLTQTYKQQAESTQAAYLSLLGNWPHKIGYVDKVNDYVSTIWVKPDGCKSDDFRKWSKIVFHCAQTGRSIPGGRIDWGHADEPPKMQMWRELRSRRRRNEPLYRWITATPLNRDEWEEMEADFEGCYQEPKHNRVLIVTSIHQNEALSKDHISRQLTDWEGDPYAVARIDGGLVDLSGKNPFTSNPAMAHQLGKWLKERTFKPTMKTVDILTEKDTADGRHMESLRVDYEEYFPPDPNDSYLITLDPSQGINDRYHDPCCMHVYSRRKRRLVALYNGYLASFGLGSLAAMVGWRYNAAIVDIDMGGAYGDSCLRAMSKMGYSNFMLELVEERGNQAPGTFRIGYKPTGPKKHAVIGEIQRAIMEDSIYIPAQSVITCLLNVTADEIGRVVAVKGRHDEHMSNLGLALVDMGRLSLPPTKAKPEPAFSEVVNREFGRPVIPAESRIVRRPSAPKGWWRK